jgi:hypothetical protein
LPGLLMHPSADGLCSCSMTNRFGFDLYPKEVRWAAAEGVSEDVIAAVLLLHDRSVDEIVPRLSATELEKVIELVGRSPRLYPRGILEALDRHRSLLATAPIAQSVPPNAAAVVSHNAAEPACRHDIRNKPDADQMRQAHERRLAMLRAHTPQSAPEPVTAEKAGTRPGTRAETIRRRYEVAQLLHLGLSVRAISMATGIPPTSVHRAKRAIARAEAKQELAVLEIMDKLIGEALLQPFPKRPPGMHQGTYKRLRARDPFAS